MRISSPNIDGSKKFLEATDQGSLFHFLIREKDITGVDLFLQNLLFLLSEAGFAVRLRWCSAPGSRHAFRSPRGATRHHPEGEDVLTAAPRMPARFMRWFTLLAASMMLDPLAFGLEARVAHTAPVLAEESELAEP